MKKILSAILFLFLTMSLSAQSYEEMVNKGMDYTDQKNYIAAEAAFKAAMRKEPGNPGNILLMVNLATVLRQLGNFDEALVYYNTAVESHPEIAFLRHNRALLYCDMGQLDNALKDYNSILLNSPDDIEALYQRGLIYSSQKRLMDAESDFEKILEINPDHYKAKSGMAMTLKRRDEWIKAEKAYSDLIDKYPKKGELYYNRAECFLQNKKLARTQDDINTALELGYNDPALLILRGQLRLAQYDKQLAKADFIKAKEAGADAVAIDELLKLCK